MTTHDGPHNRYVLFKGLPRTHRSDHGELMVEFRYLDPALCGNACKAVALDNHVIPGVRRAVDCHEELLAIARKTLAALEASDVNHPSFRDSCADVVEMLWEMNPAEVRAVITKAEGRP